MQQDANKVVVSWTAILIAALSGLGLNFLLNLLSLAIGISVFATQDNNSISVSLTGIVGFIFVAIISMFTTGWIAGKLTILPNIRKRWGLLYGFAAWSLSFVMTVVLLMNMIQFTQFHSNFTSKNLTAIKISNQAPMLTETQNSNSETEKRIIALNAYVTFFFFLIGACSSSIGGFLGFNSNKSDKYIL